LETIPVYVENVKDSDILARQMIENIQREGLSLHDTAQGVKALHNGPGGGLASYTAEKLGKSNAWVSKMLLIAGGDKSNPGASITGKLLAADKIGDLESAYMLARLEGVNPIVAQEVADNIENETRATIKKRLASVKPGKAPTDDTDDTEEDTGPMWRWILKVVESASVSKRDQPLQAAALDMIREQLAE
jgi:hypothetical protein